MELKESHDHTSSLVVISSSEKAGKVICHHYVYVILCHDYDGRCSLGTIALKMEVDTR